MRSISATHRTIGRHADGHVPGARLYRPEVFDEAIRIHIGQQGAGVPKRAIYSNRISQAQRNLSKEVLLFHSMEENRKWRNSPAEVTAQAEDGIGQTRRKRTWLLAPPADRYLSVFGMLTYPKPKEAFGKGNGQSAVVFSNADGPVPPDLLEME